MVYREDFAKSPFSINLAHRGVTFIELLVVIAIVLMLSGITGGIYARFVFSASVKDTHEHILSQLRKAQIHAINGKNNSAWGIKYTAPSLVLFSGNSYAARNTAFDEIIATNSNVTVSGLNEIVFSKTTGLPNTTTTVVITNGGNTKNIVINSQGLIQEQ